MKHDGILKDLKQIDFPETDYYREKVEKKQICLHHTVSGGSAQAVANYWKSLKNRVATCIIIEKNGVPYQLFGSHYHAGHIGNVKGECEIFKLPFYSPSKNSIGVELINWGALTKRNNKFYTAYGKEYKGEYVEYSCSYRNYNYFDKYTEAQIETLRRLLLYWGERYDIPLNYSSTIWNLNKNALKGVPGLYTHSSFRYQKSDLHPQKEMIEMLEKLTK